MSSGDAALTRRTAAAKHFHDEAVQLAVVAHVRHNETHYDELLARGVERWDAPIASARMLTASCHGGAKDDPAPRPDSDYEIDEASGLPPG